MLRALVSRIDLFDVLFLVGLLLVGAGVWAWVGFGPAAVVVGSALVALGVTGAREPGAGRAGRRAG